jgi:hypothetical protein
VVRGGTTGPAPGSPGVPPGGEWSCRNPCHACAHIRSSRVIYVCTSAPAHSTCTADHASTVPLRMHLACILHASRMHFAWPSLDRISDAILGMPSHAAVPVRPGAGALSPTRPFIISIGELDISAGELDISVGEIEISVGGDRELPSIEEVGDRADAHHRRRSSERGRPCRHKRGFVQGGERRSERWRHRGRGGGF